MNKEWQYMIDNDEIYFTSKFRFPLERVKEITLEKGKKGTIWIVGGILALVVAAAGWGIMEATQQVLLAMIGTGALLWGLKLNTTYQVGFVILKDPKWYDKVYVAILQTHSYEKAEKALTHVWEELKRKGAKRVRITKLV
jgi:hypothetical protein